MALAPALQQVQLKASTPEKMLGSGAPHPRLQPSKNVKKCLWFEQTENEPESTFSVIDALSNRV